MTDKKTIGISGGIPITQDNIDRMADEAEHGYTDAQLRRTRRGRPALGDGPARTVQARLAPDLYEALAQFAATEHSTPSQVVRDALHEYLSA